MRAAVCYEFGRPLVIEELELEPPRDGEVRVRLAACAICHSDISWWDGSWGGVLPAVFGHEAAGVVAEVGPGVAAVEPGDHVIVSLVRYCGRCYYCSQGEPVLCETRFRLDETGPLRRPDGVVVRQGLRTAAFAEEVVVHASQVVAIAPEAPLDAAALLACGVLTGVGAVVNTARVPVGSSVVVIGTGGVGLNSVQGAALSGATPIVAVDVAAEKLAAAAFFGASHTVDASSEDVRELVLGLTGGRGADYVFAAVGAKAPIEQGLSLLRRAGTLVIVGMPATGVMTEFEAGELANDSQRILGSKVGSARPEIDLPRLLELYRQGRLKLDELISARYRLDEINEAIASAHRGSALRNVIVF